MNKINNTALSLLALCLVLFSSCDKFLDIRPTGKVIAETGEEYRALLTYEYKNFPEDRGLATFRSDEFTFHRLKTKALLPIFGLGTMQHHKLLRLHLVGVATIIAFILQTQL